MDSRLTVEAYPGTDGLIERYGAGVVNDTVRMLEVELEQAKQSEATAMDLLLLLAEAHGRGVDLANTAVDVGCAGCDGAGRWNGAAMVAGPPGAQRLTLGAGT
jgi:hypothetical protein